MEQEPPVEMEVDLEQTVLARPVLRRGGRREWFRVARSELEAQLGDHQVHARAWVRLISGRLLHTLPSDKEFVGHS